LYLLDDVINDVNGVHEFRGCPANLLNAVAVASAFEGQVQGSASLEHSLDSIPR